MPTAIYAFIAAAGIDAPDQPLVPDDGGLPVEAASLNLADDGITSALWATGYGLDFSFLDMPLL